jgi:hypothetical protein
MSHIEYDGPAWECDPQGNADTRNPTRLTGTFEVASDGPLDDEYMRIRSEGIVYVIQKPTKEPMNAAQEGAFADINNNYPIATWEVRDGIVYFEADDGDTGTISDDGTWGWD